MYGHVETLARAIADDAKCVEGTDVTIKCVPEVMSEDRARKVGAKLDQEAWLCSVDALSNCDAIIFGTP